MATGGAVTYATGVFLFSDTRSGMEYALRLPASTNWLVDEMFGLWHVVEFAGILSGIFFMVSNMRRHKDV